MISPIVLSALVGASVSFLVAVLFNSLRSGKSEKLITPTYRSREEEVWD